MNSQTNQSPQKYRLDQSVLKMGDDIICVDIHLEFKGAKSKSVSFEMTFVGCVENMDRDEFIRKLVAPNVAEICKRKGRSLNSLKGYSVGPYRPLSENQIEYLISEIESKKLRDRI